METSEKNLPLAELHFHVGQSIEPHILWSIAHEQGIRLPSKDYWQFHNLITLNKSHVTWDDYHKLFSLTELIQSSPIAMERSLYETISGSYRVSNIILSEPGYNPMFRNRGGERDLDQIILASIRGMEKALVEYPSVKAGIILMLDRRLPLSQNTIILKKAIKYGGRGIVGIDIAGPHKKGFAYRDYKALYEEARAHGLKTTVHTGEDGTVEEMTHVLDTLPLNRINHGIRAVESVPLMRKLVKKNITLCLCPTSNLRVGFVKNITHLAHIVKTLWNNKVKFCFNTDNPSMLRTNLRQEIEIIRTNHILSDTQIEQTNQWAFDSSFINFKQTHENLYL